MADAKYIGQTFRQVSHRLRIQRGPGRTDKVSERPRVGSRERGWGDYRDGAPTLITFDEHDRVDVEDLLRIGAIVPWVPPEPTPDEEPAGSEAGEEASE